MSEPLLRGGGAHQAVRQPPGGRRSDFTVEAGALDALIGPNGAGKTTLFNTVSGIQPPDEGRVRLAGRRIDGLAPHEVFAAGVARTFQIPRPFPEMTVLENVMLVPSGQSGERFWNNWFAPRTVRREEIRNRERAREILAFCALEPVMGTSRVPSRAGSSSCSSSRAPLSRSRGSSSSTSPRPASTRC